MKKIIYIFGVVGLVVSMASIDRADAALVPSMSLSPTTGTSQVQITVYNADPNMSVTLYYPSNSAYTSRNIGTTNNNGYLTTMVDSSSYGIAASAPVYVMVNSQQSPTNTWPNYTSTGGSFSLSQTSITVQIGQSFTVTTPVSAVLTMASNSNPSVAGASITGNQIVITGFSFGTTNVNICAANLGCNIIAVSVPAAAGATATSIAFSQNNINLTVGQSQNISISGSGTYSISGNSNNGAVSAVISGTSLVVGGISPGTASINVCATGNNSTTCAAENVTVTSNTNNTNTTTNTQTSITFSQSQINLSVGQSQTIAIYGPGGYYSVTNSAPSSVSASQNGNTIILVGQAFGGANVSVCTLDNKCGSFYVYVAPTNTTTTVISTAQAPTLSSFTVSSNGSNGFVGTGSTLTFTLNANQSINTPSLSVAGHGVIVSGTGSGPYTATYAIAGNETLPMSVAATFTNVAGSGGQAYIWIGNSASIAPAVVSTTPSTVYPTSAVQTPSYAPAAFTSFDKYLYSGMTSKDESDQDVVALQKRLKADGVFSGPVTGYFGPVTQTAVKAYQAKHKLTQTGTVGPATRNLLNKEL